MKRSKSETNMKNMVHHNIDIYRSISEHITEINGIIYEIKQIDIELEELSTEISDKKNTDLDNEFISLLLERGINQEMLECVGSQLEYNLHIL